MMQMALTRTSPGPLTQVRREKIFFFTMSLAMAVTIFLGFARSYYLRGYFGSPQLPLLFAVHGAVFSCWMVFFVAQAWLAMDGRLNLHRQMGLVGATLASLMVILGAGVALASARLGHFAKIPGAANASEALLFSLFDIGLFGVFVWAGFQWRLNAAAHPRIMLLAVAAPLLPSAIGRACYFQPALAVPFILIFMLAGPAFDLLTRKRVHGAYLLGLALVLLTAPPLRILLARTPAWRWAYLHLVG